MHFCDVVHLVAQQEWRLNVKKECLSFKVDPSLSKSPGGGTEVIPGKHSDTRIKALAYTKGHGRYMTVTPERTLVSVGECELNKEPLNFCSIGERNYGRVQKPWHISPHALSS